MEDKEKNKTDETEAPKTAQNFVLQRSHKISYEYKKPQKDMEEEVMGRDGPEPTRYGDWEVDGKCTDF